MKGKLKNNKLLLAIWCPVIAVLFIIIFVGTIVCNYFSSTIDYHLGGGGSSIIGGSAPAALTDYYDAAGLTVEQAAAETKPIVRQISDEGSVLLKNNGVLPLAEKSEVAPFGYAYLHPVYTGTGAGSSSSANIITPEAGLSEYFEINHASVDKMSGKNPVQMSALPGTVQVGGGDSMLATSRLNNIFEFDASIYNGTESLVRNSTGIVFIAREGSEGDDKKFDGYTDGTPHYLALSAQEKATIRFAKENCKNVVVVIVSSNVMELGCLMSGELEADAILWVGNPGAVGFESMGKILVGEVNPSGKTVDIWASDFTKDPVYNNFGFFTYSNSNYNNEGRYFAEYEEGVYFGYRYYETADFMARTLEDYDFDYDEAVVFPFGYGLSYADKDGGFKQEITNFDDSGDTIDIEVTVTNNSKTYDGKDVVQVYFEAPYTQFDIDRKIEKSTVNLVAFAKTGIISKNGGTETVNISFKKEEMASYCYTVENADGTKGAYVLEEGDYNITLRTDSHNVIETETVNIPETVWYSGDNKRSSDAVAASNRFQEENDYMAETGCTNLSRADWKNTFPTRPENNTKELPAKYKNLLEEANVMSFDPETDSQLGNIAGSKVYSATAPTGNADNGLTITDMRGLPYDDERWEKLLDQVNWTSSNKITRFLFNAGYGTEELESVGKTFKTVDGDGSTGLQQISGASSFASTPVLASTWNLDLMYNLGRAVGREAIAGGYNGWYAPAMNTHRSPFGGRNFEYFSEDGVLAGKLAERIVSGAGDSGLYCYIKHFFANDQETMRDKAFCSWATEQTFREIYLKPFEICLKEATKTVNYIQKNSDGEWEKQSVQMKAGDALMLSQANIGDESAMTDYALLTKLLRDEWDFEGVIITDLYFVGGESLPDAYLRAGGNLWLGNKRLLDNTSATAQQLMRESVHRTLYVTANSNALQGVAPGATKVTGMAPWRIALIIGNVVVYLFIAAMIGFIVYRLVDAKKHPERYKSKCTVKESVSSDDTV